MCTLHLSALCTEGACIYHIKSTDRFLAQPTGFGGIKKTKDPYNTLVSHPLQPLVTVTPWSHIPKCHCAATKMHVFRRWPCVSICNQWGQSSNSFRYGTPGNCPYGQFKGGGQSVLGKTKKSLPLLVSYYLLCRRVWNGLKHATWRPLQLHVHLSLRRCRKCVWRKRGGVEGTDSKQHSLNCATPGLLRAFSLLC